MEKGCIAIGRVFVSGIKKPEAGFGFFISS